MISNRLAQLRTDDSNVATDQRLPLRNRCAVRVAVALLVYICPSANPLASDLRSCERSGTTAAFQKWRDPRAFYAAEIERHRESLKKTAQLRADMKKTDAMV